MPLGCPNRYMGGYLNVIAGGDIEVACYHVSRGHRASTDHVIEEYPSNEAIRF